MSRRVRLRHDAERDLLEAARWYQRQRPGLGQEFLDAAQSMMRKIADQPHSFPAVHRNTRRALVERFPFAVYFREADAQIVVIAVLHGSRHPRRWQRR